MARARRLPLDDPERRQARQRPHKINTRANDYVDLEKAAWALRARRLRLLSEPELVQFAPACELGALPPVDLSDRTPIYADYAFAGLETITFRAGSHRYAVTVDRSAWERAVGARYCSLAETVPVRPELQEWY